MRNRIFTWLVVAIVGLISMFGSGKAVDLIASSIGQKGWKNSTKPKGLTLRLLFGLLTVMSIKTVSDHANKLTGVDVNKVKNPLNV